MKPVLAGLLVAAIAAGVGPAPELPEYRGRTIEPPVYTAMAPERAMLLADADLLARVAKSEDPSAPAAVIWTVLNRTRGRAVDVLPTATSGAYHGMARPHRWSSSADRAQLERCRRVALDVLEGRRPDPTRGATHFHRVGSPTPAWAPDPGAWRQLGNHVFYRERPRVVPVSR